MQLRAVLNAAILTLLCTIFLIPANSYGDENFAPVGKTEITALANNGRFIPNYGQWPSEVKFRATVNGVTLWFTKDGVYHDFVRESKPNQTASSSLDVETYEGPAPTFERLMVASKFVDAATEPELVGLAETSERVNIFHGADQSKWRTDIPVFEQIEYRSLYDGIDLVYRVTDNQLEYDLNVAPGADYQAVRFEYQNVDDVTVDSEGSLRARTAWGEIVEQAPQVSQQAVSGSEQLRGQFQLTGENSFRFELLDRPDPASPILVDPLVSYIYGNGGVANDEGFGIAVDDDGYAYVVGYSSSTDFPTVNPLQPTQGGGLYDAILVKLNQDGSQVLYSTYFGGSEDDRGHDIAVDQSGAAYITGYTISTDFPLHLPYQSSHGGGVYDAFVTKISPQGNALIYSTYLGGLGDDIGNGIVVNSKGEAHLTGQTRSTDFPTVEPKQAALAGVNYDAFVTKFNAAGSAILYSTYLGGTSSEYGRGIDLLPAGNAVICGFTSSSDLPVVNAMQNSLAGGVDAFIANLTINFSSPGFVTYFGGSGNDYAEGISAAADYSTFVTGYTFSTNFPTRNPLQGSHAGGIRDLFAAHLDIMGNSLLYSTYLGGSDEDYLYSSALTPDGRLCLTGQCFSNDFPLVNPYKASISGLSDAFVTILASDGSALSYSTFVGGGRDDIGYDIDIDTAGSVYITGTTGELFSGAPKSPDDNETLATGLLDMFVVKFAESESCCGYYTGGFTGNTDCSADGKINLADVTRLIDRVYVTKTALCCEANGNVDGGTDGKLNLADITKLIDHIYLTKADTAPCI